MQYPTSTGARRGRLGLSLLPLLLALACAPSSGSGASGGAGGGSGAAGSGGTNSGSGGKAGSGGTSPSGGKAGSGGNAGSGGTAGSGGNAGSGGSAGAGGKAGAVGGAGGSAGGGGGGAGGQAGSGGAVTGGKNGGTEGASALGGNGGGVGGRTGTGGISTATGGSTSANGGSTGANGGSTGSGGSTTGMCASAFFSADAAAKRATEYTAWKTAFVQECSNGSAVVKNGGGVYSEGIGYGMLLAVNNDDQKLFDKLWKFYTDHLDANGLMNWSMDACAAPGDNKANAATDGDLDAAMGLVVADKKWGGYKTQALDLIGKIKEFETDTCKLSNGSELLLLRPGDKWGGCTENPTKGKTNPSYFAPGYYRAFATIDAANADFWQKLITDSYTLLAQYQKAMNGLVPEWGFSDGTTEGNSYDYNACRTPWRIAMDYMWSCAPEAKTVLESFAKFVDGKGGVTKTGYANNSAFVGGFATAGIAISQAKIDAYVKDWLGATGMDDTPYFQGTLRRLYLLVAGGQFLPGM